MIPLLAGRQGQTRRWLGRGRHRQRKRQLNLPTLPEKDAQSEDGRIPSVAPMPPGVALLGKMDGGPAWGDAVVICPWTIWRCYGDERLLEERWSSMHRYIDYLIEKFPDGIRSDPARDREPSAGA